MFTLKANTPLFTIILSVLISSIVVSCSGRKADPELARLDREATLSMSTYSKEGLDSTGILLLEKARAKGNRSYEGKAHFFLSSFRSGLSDTERKERLNHLDIAEKIADETDNDTLRSMVYNQRGVWELADSYSPVTAQYWFARSIESTSGLGKRFYSIPAEMNMSEACRMSGDTIGIRYDRELFKYALKEDEPLLRFTAGFHCAYYYASTANDTSELRPYIEAMRLMEREFPGASEMVYAKFFFAKGRYDEAEHFISRSQPDNYPDFQILYAEILNKLGKFEESERMAQKAMPSRNSLSFSDYGNLLRIRAANMDALGNLKEAYRRLGEYEVFRDSIARTRSLDLMKRYRTEYEVAAKDREILEQRIRIRTMTFTISAIVALAIIAALFYFLWDRRRNRFYKDIVRQNREFIDRQDLLEKSIARRDSVISDLEDRMRRERQTDAQPANGHDGAADNPRINDGPVAEAPGLQGGLSDERIDEIFDRILTLCDKEQVWRDTSMTRDTFAARVGCNRTYLTEVIKAKTGMGYSQYMNSCRIREAVRVLSDSDNSIQLKKLSADIGFMTIQTFYSAFRQQIGMSPAAFRKAALDDTATETDRLH